MYKLYTNKFVGSRINDIGIDIITRNWKLKEMMKNEKDDELRIEIN